MMIGGFSEWEKEEGEPDSPCKDYPCSNPEQDHNGPPKTGQNRDLFPDAI
jgi:hypothetical protein